MIEVVIKYDSVKNYYLVYEPSTESLMICSNLSEALINLNKLLKDKGMIKEDILNGDQQISYHIDSATMKAIVEGNLSLIKRLRNAPSGFMISSQRLGQKQQVTKKDDKKGFSSTKKSTNNFQGAKGFIDSYKKFGNRKL